MHTHAGHSGGAQDHDAGEKNRRIKKTRRPEPELEILVTVRVSRCVPVYFFVLCNRHWFNSLRVPGSSSQAGPGIAGVTVTPVLCHGFM